MFINYWFVIFTLLFFPIFWCCTQPSFRKYWLLLACIIFHYQFAGPAGVIPIIILGVLTYFAGILNNKSFRMVTIIIAVLALVFYKYTTFLTTQIVGIFSEEAAQTMLTNIKKSLLPDAPPLAISFFVFEFVHYLVDVHRGKPPIRSVTNFTLFSIFWPSVVAGPVKRFEQFLPALAQGCRKVSGLDIQIGMMRIVIGLTKKLMIADNLTAYIDFWQPQFHALPWEKRWLIVLAISFRILFDFSGYSDMAIGFARMMGIKLPENFNWPYLATSLQDFWRRWHISLSSWIRDYIYIPLGGNQNGPIRKMINGITAFAICGLWHGAAWNFIFWGLYHGVGLVVFAKIAEIFGRTRIVNYGAILITPLTWLVTFIYVSIGWLYFFYPVDVASKMLLRLIK